MKRGGGGNGQWMWCRAWGSGSMAGDARAARGGNERPMAVVPALLQC
jgi:hypothetical protein